MTIFLRIIFSLLVVSLLAACASGPTYYQPIADEQISKPDKNGVIFLRVAHAFPGLRENTLILQALNPDKTISVISALDDDGEYSSSFLASLPPGNYTIARLGEHSQYFQNDIVLKQSVGSFTVRAGGFTNLGTLIIGKEVVMRSGEEAPTPKIWQNQFPNLYRRLTSSNLAGWNTPTTNMTTWEQLGDRFQPMHGELVDGLISLGTLSTIRIRNAQGNWQTIYLHNTAHALGYARNNNGVEFAALEYRQLFLRAPGSSSWKAIAAPDDRGKIVYTKFAKNGLLYLAITEKDGAVKIYATAPDAVQWHLVGNIGITLPTDVIDMLPGNSRPKIDPLVSVAEGPSDNIFITQFGFGALLSHDAFQLTRFDFSSNTTQSLNPPFSSKRLIEITSTNGVVSAHQRFYLASDADRLLYKSSDNGLNWQSIAYDAKKDGQVMALTSAVKFIDSNIGFAVFNGSSLMRTDDGGYHWSMVNLPTKPHQVPAPVSLVTGGSPNELLIAREGHYEISRDQGQSWQVEH